MQVQAGDALGNLAAGPHHNKDAIKAMGAVSLLVALLSLGQSHVQASALCALRDLGLTRMQFLRSLFQYTLLQLPGLPG